MSESPDLRTAMPPPTNRRDVSKFKCRLANDAVARRKGILKEVPPPAPRRILSGVGLQGASVKLYGFAPQPDTAKRRARVEDLLRRAPEATDDSTPPEDIFMEYETEIFLNGETMPDAVKADWLQRIVNLGAAMTTASQAKQLTVTQLDVSSPVTVAALLYRVVAPCVHRITVIELPFAQLTDDGLCLLCEWMAYERTNWVTHLDVSFNHLTYQAMDFVKLAVQHSCLKHVNLRNNNLSEPHAPTQLLDLITDCPTLESLDVSFCHIPVEHISNFVISATAMGNITNLGLDGLDFNVANGMRLVDNLQSNTTIQQLSLRHVPATTSRLFRQRLATLLQRNQRVLAARALGGGVGTTMSRLKSHASLAGTLGAASATFGGTARWGSGAFGGGEEDSVGAGSDDDEAADGGVPRHYGAYTTNEPSVAAARLQHTHVGDDKSTVASSLAVLPVVVPPLRR